ncbi:MAG: hypothetical protein B6I26_01325 [Desulfobacteraceae bacterium 4572_130]|nr:MAG: hypothetical protein B6I26_01325 [Desulfobacteraceae bacterium 4572_130]
MNEEKYINERLEKQILWYSKESRFNQKFHKLLRLTEIIFAALIPFLAGMVGKIPYSTWIIGGLGVVIAVCAGASSVWKFHENWIQYRTSAETLKHEKYLYLTKSYPYNEENQENAFNYFVKRVENLISKENTQWAGHTEKKNESKI